MAAHPSLRLSIRHPVAGRAAPRFYSGRMNTPHSPRRFIPHPWALGLCALLAAAPALAQSWRAAPAAQALAGDHTALVLEGVPPGAEVQVQATRLVREWTGQPRSYRSSAVFKADEAGRVDLARAVPQSGSYAGADLRGLFWSMQPAPAGTEAPAPEQVLLQARRADGSLLAATTLSLRSAAPDISARRAAPFEGALFAVAPGGGARPALILLGGSEGGSAITRDAPAWASRGYAVLALPYYSPAGWSPSGPTPAELPSLSPAFADIPVQRLQAARDWLAQQPEVDAARIAVMGTSKGAEFALLAASRMPWVRAVVAIVPSDVVWEGWGPGVAPGSRSSFAWNGQPLAFVPYQDFDKELMGFATGAEVKFRRPQDKGRAANPGRVAAARIRVEDIAVPVLVAGAHDDQVWDSGSMSEAIAATRRQAGLPTEVLVFRDAGHALGGTGWSPTTQYNAGPMKMGGTPEATARAQADVHARTVAFLQQQLKP